jgi:hypothetical protein
MLQSHRYSSDEKPDLRRPMSPPHRQNVAEVSKGLGRHVIDLYKQRETEWLEGEVMPTTELEQESWSAVERGTLVMENAGLNNKESNDRRQRSST